MILVFVALPSKVPEEVSTNGVTPLVGNKKSAKSESVSGGDTKEHNTKNKQTSHIEDCQYIEQSVHQRHPHSINDYDEENYKNDQHAKTFKANGVTKSTNKLNSSKEVSSNKKGKSNNAKEASANTANTNTFTNNKEDTITR